MTVQFGAGKAEMNVQNLSLQDHFTIPNALGPNWNTNFDPATVSFDVVWSGPITRSLSFTDSTDVDQFTGNYNQNQVTVNWSGTNLITGFSFTANPGTFSTSSVDGGFAELGQEQNGSFFQGDSRTQQVNSAAAIFATQTAAGQALPGAKLALQPVVGVLARGGPDLGYHNYLGVGLGQPPTARAGILSSHTPAKTVTAVRAAHDRIFELASDSAESWAIASVDIEH